MLAHKQNQIPKDIEKKYRLNQSSISKLRSFEYPFYESAKFVSLYNLSIELLKIGLFVGWRDDSAICKWLEFSSQRPWLTTACACNSSSKGPNALFWPLQAPALTHAHTIHTETHMHNQK